MTCASEPLGAPPCPAARTSPDVVTPNTATPRWRSRRRLLHLEHPGIIQSVTFRLHDAFPAIKIKEWERELSHHPAKDRDQKLRAQIEKYLDASHGCCWLREPRIGRLVEHAMLFFDGIRYHLLAWCVMPNHVHVLFETKPEWDLGTLIHPWKGYSAHHANRLLGRKGTFWQREYFDRFVRDGNHYERVLGYIEENPVKAGLVSMATDWPMSSATWRRKEETLPIT